MSPIAIIVALIVVITTILAAALGVDADFLTFFVTLGFGVSMAFFVLPFVQTLFSCVLGALVAVIRRYKPVFIRARWGNSMGYNNNRCFYPCYLGV